MDVNYWLATIALVAIKALLIPTYHSTDFDVHRNWLAITHSLPVSRWYYEDTSEWTLDYPPMFAWFEWCLSCIARHVDPDMLVIQNLNYASISTILFQRCSVITTDFVLVTASWYAARRTQAKAAGLFTFLLIAGNAGLLLVDHIHFQYNGLLLGILLWSVLLIEAGHDLLGGILFAVLLNMKHLFAYAAPVYFVYLLRRLMGRPGFPRRLLLLAAGVVGVFAASFGPFLAEGQLQQIMKRLFPFGRGLVHSYWAANFWGLYCFGDKVLLTLLPKLGFQIEVPVGHLAGGVVGVSSFAVLPQVPPKATMAAVLLAMLPCLVQLWRRPQAGQFARAVAYAHLCGFMFGYHVHEKAILTVILPMALYAGQRSCDAAAFLLLSTAGHYALCPLLFQPQEYPIKLLLVVIYCMMSWRGLAEQLYFDTEQDGLEAASTMHHTGASAPGQAGQGSLLPGVHSQPLAAQDGQDIRDGHRKLDPGSRRQHMKRSQSLSGFEPSQPDGTLQLNALAMAYLVGFVLLELFCSTVHPLLLADRLPFLPLLLISVYCGLGVAWVWLSLAWEYTTGQLPQPGPEER